MAYDPYAASLGWGGGTPQDTTSLGVPTSTGWTAQLDQVSPIAQQMWEEEQRRKAMQPPQQPYDYGAGTSFGGAATGSPVLPTPVAQPEVAKPMPYGGGTMYAGGSNNGVENAQNLPSYMNAGGQPGWGGLGGSGGQVGFNPNLGAYSDDITRRVNLSRDMGLQAIRGDAIGGAGGLGGTRQGVAEGLAISGAADNLAGNLTNMYLQDWTGQKNRDLQSDSLRNNFYLGNRSLDYQGVGLGADLIDKGFGTEWSPINQTNRTYGTYLDNGTTSSSASGGGGAMGILGGAGAGYQLYKDLTSKNNTQQTNNGGNTVWW